MQIIAYIKLMRIDKPIGSLLLLWPTLTALWIASQGQPPIELIVIFILGTFVMRSAGCVINDFADRNFDGEVERTKSRPLPTGKVKPIEAIALFLVLSLCGASLLIFLNRFTQLLALLAIFLIVLYPFSKRWTHLPQLVLGIAFSWGILMAWSAITNELTLIPLVLFLTSIIWIIAYDSLYAMIDREDDLSIGIKSSAILFGNKAHLIIGTLMFFTVLGFCLFGSLLDFGSFYYIGVMFCFLLFIYQLKLISNKSRENYFKAFLNNNWVGLGLFAGTVLETTPWTAL
ncbi:MAG: 4-hydroxybenzoate octaprenyltransferase [Candidatus Azotimanducaceae bacterium]